MPPSRRRLHSPRTGPPFRCSTIPGRASWPCRPHRKGAIVMGDIKITDNSSLAVTGEDGHNPVHVEIDNDPVHVEIDGSNLEIRGTNKYPLYIDALQNIAPIAAHIKEVNHIDPLSVESLFVSQVRNIEPLRITKFNVTNLPLVNLAVRQIPAVDLNVRRLPARLTKGR